MNGKSLSSYSIRNNSTLQVYDRSFDTVKPDDNEFTISLRYRIPKSDSQLQDGYVWDSQGIESFKVKKTDTILTLHALFEKECGFAHKDPFYVRDPETNNWTKMEKSKLVSDYNLSKESLIWDGYTKAVVVYSFLLINGTLAHG